MKRSFPSVQVPDAELSLAHDFVLSILKWDRKKRPPVEKIKRHRFLKNLEKGHSVIETEKKTSKIEASGDGCVNPESALRLPTAAETEIKMKPILNNGHHTVKNSNSERQKYSILPEAGKPNEGSDSNHRDRSVDETSATENGKFDT